MSLTNLQIEDERQAEKTFREVAPHLVRACDAILKEHPEQIVVIGTGGRGIYSVMRHLAVGLKDRGPHTRVKLADVSTSLLFGRTYPSNRISKPDDFLTTADPKRNSQIYNYLSSLGITGKKPVLLIDTAFRGTVIKNLREILKKRLPRKKVRLMLFRKTEGSKEIEMPPGVDMETGLKIATALEHGRGYLTQANVTIGGNLHGDFVQWKRGLRPKYQPTDLKSSRMTRIKHQIFAEAVDQHIAEQKKKAEY